MEDYWDDLESDARGDVMVDAYGDEDREEDDGDGIGDIGVTVPEVDWRVLQARATRALRDAVAAGNGDVAKRARRDLIRALVLKHEEQNELPVLPESGMVDDESEDSAAAEDAGGESPEAKEEEPVKRAETVVKSPPKGRSGRSGTVRPPRQRSASWSGAVPDLTPVPAADVESELLRPDILGYTGEEYHGRRVVLYRKNPGAFGGTPLKREQNVRLTLHRGILNQMEVGDLSRTPTPYWAVLDAASDLRDGFRMEEVLSRALTTIGDDTQLKACRVAWYVLKSHQTHPKERYRGMGFIFEEVDTPSGPRIVLRGRRSHETCGYFDEGRIERQAQRVSSAGGGKTQARRGRSSDEVPLVTHVVGSAR